MRFPTAAAAYDMLLTIAAACSAPTARRLPLRIAIARNCASREQTMGSQFAVGDSLHRCVCSAALLSGLLRLGNYILWDSVPSYPASTGISGNDVGCLPAPSRPPSSFRISRLKASHLGCSARVATSGLDDAAMPSCELLEPPHSEAFHVDLPVGPRPCPAQAASDEPSDACSRIVSDQMRQRCTLNHPAPAPGCGGSAQRLKQSSQAITLSQSLREPHITGRIRCLPMSFPGNAAANYSTHYCHTN
jgi:hypothetical protein